MFDFNRVFKLSTSYIGAYNSEITPLLANGEKILSVYKGARDGVVFTNMRMIAIDIQGMFGSKYSAMSFPYESIKLFCIETAGFIDIDAMLSIWITGMGCVRFAFSPNVNINAVAKILSNHILKPPAELSEPTAPTDDQPVMQCPNCGKKFYNKVKTCYKCDVPLVISKDPT